MELEVKELIVPKQCFPRLIYAARYVPKLEKRCIELMQRVGLDTSKVLSGRHLDHFYVHVYRNQDNKGNEEEVISADEIAYRNPEKIKSTNVQLCQPLQAALKQHKAAERNILVVITNSKMKNEILQLKDRYSQYIVHVASSSKEASELKKEMEVRITEMDILFTTKKLLSGEVNNLLEKIAYEPLKSAFEVLKKLLRSDQEGELLTAGKSKRKRLRDVDKVLIECLCEEILALYEISNVPEQQRPKSFQEIDHISKEVREDIFKRCSTVEALGFHFNNLHVYVKENAERVEESRDEEIKKILEKHNVNNYRITVLSGPFIELMDTGSTIEARDTKSSNKKVGSLGCYADVEDDQTSQTCLLLSRHVAIGCTEIHIVENDQEKMIATVIEETTKHEHGSLDIAAAAVIDDILVEEDARKLKDSEGYLRKGNICDNSEGGKMLRKGRKVHIWGSNSRPGYGIITDASYSIKGMEVNLIQIQDEEGCNDDQGELFAVEGDSGSIVCSDDPNDESVHALGMLVGLNNEWKCDSNSDVKRKYLSLPLKEGVKQLESQTYKKFILFRKK